MQIHKYNVCSCSAEALPSLHTRVRSENSDVSQSTGWTSLFGTGLIEMCTFNMSDCNTSERMNSEIKVANKNTDRCVSGIYFNSYIKGGELTSILSTPFSVHAGYIQNLFVI